jgi:hypothetical protein
MIFLSHLTSCENILVFWLRVPRDPRSVWTLKNNSFAEVIHHQGYGQLFLGDGKIFEGMGLLSGWTEGFLRGFYIA